MKQEPKPVAQRSEDRLYFQDKDLDYYLSWIVGREATGGSLRNECLQAAAKISEDSPTSWQQEWTRLGEQVESDAASKLNQGNREEAYTAYLHACSYYRASLFIMSAQDDLFRTNAAKMRKCFRQAVALSGQPIETVSVPFRGCSLDGYLWKPDPSNEPRPTMVVIGGIETFAEDCYFMIGSSAPEKGYNVITVDLPGQGFNPDQGLFLEAKSEIPIRAVTDYVLSRPEVDSRKLVFYGFSWGGHIVLRGIQGDSRVSALIANPATTNIFSSALAQQSGHGKGSPIGQLVFEQLAWRFGVRLGAKTRRLAKGLGFLVYARANPRKITCPTLCIAGESEAKVTLDQTRRCYEQLPHPAKRLAILAKEQGGAAHCQVDNLPLLHRLIFGWLRELS